jgi:tRNA A37 threonylcarbamoyladenosine dehydratase
MESNPPSSDSDPRFGGVARLYGQSGLGRFSRARVAVVGIGGVGTWAVECLARSGVGHLTLVDLDEICVTNVNRQIHALDGQIGMQKAEAMAARVRAIHPACEVNVVSAFFNERTAEEILGSGFDAVVDAIDTLRHKALLVAECHARNVRVVTCGAAGGRRDPTRIRTADLSVSGGDPLLHALRRNLRREHGFPTIPMGTKPTSLGIDAVFSDEPQVFPDGEGGVSCARDAMQNDGPRLGCEAGYGSAAHVTGCFGMVAAGIVLERIAMQAD